MGNFKTAIKAVDDAEQGMATNSARKENAKYMDSIEGKLAALKSAWSKFSNEMINSDMIKNALTALTGIVNFLASDMGQLAIKAAGALVGLKAFTKVIGVLKATKISSILTTAITSMAGFSQATNVTTKSLANGSNRFKNFSRVATTSTAKIASEGSKLSRVGGKIGSAFGRLGGILPHPFILAAGAVVALGYALSKIPTAQEKLENGEKKLKTLQNKYDEATQKAEEYRKKAEEASEAGKDNTEILKNAEHWEEVAQKTQDAIDKQEIYNKKAFVEAQKPHDEGASITGYDPDLGEGQRGTTNLTEGERAIVRYKSAVDNANKSSIAWAKAEAKLNVLRKQGKQGTKEYNDALDKATTLAEQDDRAQQNLADVTKEVNKQYKDYKKYGDELGESGKKTRKDLKEIIDGMDGTSDATQKVKKAYENLGKRIGEGKLLKKGTLKATIKDFKALGDRIGVTTNKAGKINKINVDKFKSGLKELGASSKDVDGIIEKLKKQNPNIKFTTNAKDAEKDLDNVDKKAKKKSTKNVDVKTNSKDAQKKLDEIREQVISDKSFKITANDTSAKNSVSFFQGLPNIIGSAIYKIKTQVTEEKGKKPKEKNGTRHFASGTPNAEVNEQGFEIIQSPNGSMKVVNGGKRGLTYVEKGSAIYTHGQSMRMLQKAGMTEADLLQGKEGDVKVVGVNKLKGFAGGLTQKQYNKKRDKLRAKYDSAVETAEYKQERYHYSDAWLVKQIKKARSSYLTALKKLNKQKVKKGVDKATGLGTDRERDYRLAISDLSHDTAQKEIEAQMKELEFSRKTYKKLTDLVKKYYKNKKISAEEYQDYLDELGEMEVARVRSNYENQWDYISQYIQRQIDLEEKNNDVIEAQSELLKAQAQRVKVYREGQGWVYEQNAEAVREAQANLKEYTSVWEEIQDMMNDMDAQAELMKAETLAGKQLVKAVESAGADLSTWVQILAKVSGGTAGLELAEDLGITNPKDIKYKEKTVEVRGQTFNISNISLPSVVDTSTFVKELQKLGNNAIQTSLTR